MCVEVSLAIRRRRGRFFSVLIFFHTVLPSVYRDTVPETVLSIRIIMIFFEPFKQYRQPLTILSNKYMYFFTALDECVHLRRFTKSITNQNFPFYCKQSRNLGRLARFAKITRNAHKLVFMP